MEQEMCTRRFYGRLGFWRRPTKGAVTQVGGARKCYKIDGPCRNLMTNAEIQFARQFNFWSVQVKIKFE